MPVDVQWSSSDPASFEPCSAHSDPNSLDDQIIAPTMTVIARPSGPPVSICSRKLREFDARMIQFVEDLQEMSDGTSHPIRGPNEDRIEAVPPSTGHQFIEPWMFLTWLPRSRRCTRRRCHSRAALPSHADHITGLGVLVGSWHAGVPRALVECNSAPFVAFVYLHRLRS